MANIYLTLNNISVLAAWPALTMDSRHYLSDKMIINSSQHYMEMMIGLTSAGQMNHNWHTETGF